MTVRDPPWSCLSHLECSVTAYGARAGLEARVLVPESGPGTDWIQALRATGGVEGDGEMAVFKTASGLE